MDESVTKLAVNQDSDKIFTLNGRINCKKTDSGVIEHCEG